MVNKPSEKILRTKVGASYPRLIRNEKSKMIALSARTPRKIRIEKRISSGILIRLICADAWVAMWELKKDLKLSRKVSKRYRASTTTTVATRKASSLFL